jgi:L-alanine-DL-glutamate epimerase-like enolase superfamily enzyme
MRHQAWIVPLRLRHPFGLSRGTASELPTVLLRLGGGLGEAAPVRYLGHSAAALRDHLQQRCEALSEPDFLDMSQELAPESAPAPVRAALDIARWDARARAAGSPLRDLLDHDQPDHPPAPGPGARQTSYTIALDELDAMAARAAEAAHVPLLKIKLGKNPDFDRLALRRIAAAAPGARLRVDANGGWSFEQARELLPELAALGVEFVEQPLAHGQPEALGALRRHSPLPIFADEDVQGPATLAALRGQIDGINIKLMKCGGISPALAMIAVARQEGWRVLLGCMIESRVGLAAAASLAGRVDEVDLDAHMLTRDDPVPPGSQSGLSGDIPHLSGPGLGIPLSW